MGGSPRQQGSVAGGHGKPCQQAPPEAAESSSDGEEEVNRSGASSSADSGSRSSSAADSAGPAGSEVVVQSGEAVDLPPFSGKLDKPMMEMVAGSNVWYQAHILQSSKTKLRVLFPAPTEEKKDKREWVLRTSSRIWRGSMSSRDWKYLSKGAWAPRAKSSRSRKAAARSRAVAGRKPPGSYTHGTTASGTGGAAASEAAAGGHGGGEIAGHHTDDEEPDVASPRKRPRRAQSAGGSPASSGSDGDDDGHMGAFERLRPSGGGGHGAAAAAAAAPGTAAGGAQQQGDAAGARQRQAQRQQQQDPLAAWFVHHFTLLDKAGLLGDNYTSCSAEAGFLPPCQPAQQSCGTAAPASGGAPAHGSKQAGGQQRQRPGQPHGAPGCGSTGQGHQQTGGCGAAAAEPQPAPRAAVVAAVSGGGGRPTAAANGHAAAGMGSGSSRKARQWADQGKGPALQQRSGSRQGIAAQQIGNVDEYARKLGGVKGV